MVIHRYPLTHLVLLALSSGAMGQIRGPLADLSLKDLMNITVASVSKREQSLQDAATGIYVISREDIRRSGASRLSDVLKMAPGVWFTDNSRHLTSFAIRESMDPFSQSVLFMVDGIPMTNQVLGGPTFHLQHLPLEEIDRIEVIRGPGGTIYGANATAAIVNIYTTPPEDMEGVQVVNRFGRLDHRSGFLRIGGQPGPRISLSGWLHHQNERDYDNPDAFSGDSLWAERRNDLDTLVANRFGDPRRGHSFLRAGGMKLGYRRGESTHLQMRGWWERWRLMAYRMLPPIWPESPGPFPRDTAWLMTEEAENITVGLRLDHEFSETHDIFLNAFYRRRNHDAVQTGGRGINFDVSELELQDNFILGGMHAFSLGANLRQVRFDIEPHGMQPGVSFANPRNTEYIIGALLQDHMQLGPRWEFILGTKLETWTLIKMTPEVIPSARLVYKPTPDLTFWSAASRSITTPGYIQADLEYRGLQLPPAWYYQSRNETPIKAAGKWVAVVPGPQLKPTSYRTLETGLRTSMRKAWSIDVTGFISELNDVVLVAPFDPDIIIPSRVRDDSIVPVYYANLVDKKQAGVELLGRWRPYRPLRLEATYSLNTRLDSRGLRLPGEDRNYVSGESTRVPEHIASLRAYLDLPEDLDLTSNFTYVSPYEVGDFYDFAAQTPEGQYAIAVEKKFHRYYLDAMIEKGWHRNRLKLALWGRNLLADGQVEIFNRFANPGFPAQTHRTYGIRLSYGF